MRVDDQMCAEAVSVHEFATLAYSTVTRLIIRAVFEDIGMNLTLQSSSRFGFDTEIFFKGLDKRYKGISSSHLCPNTLPMSFERS